MADWIRDTRGAILRQSKENAVRAIREYYCGYKDLDILMRPWSSMHALANDIEYFHSYRPTLKALRSAVEHIREEVRSAVEEMALPAKGEFAGKWKCAGCTNHKSSWNLYFYGGRFLCADCIPHSEFQKGPISLYNARNDLDAKGML